MKKAFILLLSLNAAIQGFFGVQLTFNTNAFVAKFNNVQQLTQIEFNQSMFFGTSLLMSFVLLIYAIYLTTKESKPGIILGIMLSLYPFALGFFALFLIHTSDFLVFDSIRGGLAAVAGYLYLRKRNLNKSEDHFN